MDFAIHKSIPDVNGECVPNGKLYFDRIGQGELIENTPVFDYFHLESFATSDKWEWRLQDIHGFIGVGSIITGWFISKRFKQVLELFKIAPRFKFYSSKLLYRGDKLDYYILQFAGESFDNMVIQSSVFYEGDDKGEIVEGILNKEDYLLKRRYLYKTLKKDLNISTIVLVENYDLIPLYGISSDVVVSEFLRIAIENAKIEGVKFEEIDYKVVPPC